MSALRRVLVLLGALGLAAGSASATVEMQVDAKKLGLPVGSCLYCHATPHSVDVMKQRARAARINEGNCLACHGGNIPARLNARGEWLVAERKKRRARRCDMAWLKEYKEPATPPATARPPRP